MDRLSGQCRHQLRTIVEAGWCPRGAFALRRRRLTGSYARDVDQPYMYLTGAGEAQISQRTGARVLAHYPR
jgi:hypothetical protein